VATVALSLASKRMSMPTINQCKSAEWPLDDDDDEFCKLIHTCTASQIVDEYHCPRPVCLYKDLEPVVADLLWNLFAALKARL
jgi:hypothetical protein